MTKLTHFDNEGQAHMVDVGDKAETQRIAVATGNIRMQPATFALIQAGDAKKGDVLGVARIAAIQASKKTSDLIPLCHPIALNKVEIELNVEVDGVSIFATAKTTDRTGVEMEALTAVSITGLTLIDMIKALDPHASITNIQVESKSGGKTGDWHR